MVFAKNVWEGIKVIEPKVIVPQEVIDILKAIEKKIRRDVEFSVLFKGGWTEEGFKVEPEFIIPKQKVSYASVDYTDEKMAEYIQQGYVVVVHKHPSGIRSFSATDEEYINQNFDCSLLYCDGQITDARLRIKVSGYIYLKIKPQVEVIPRPVNLPEEQLKNIEFETYTYATYRKTKRLKEVEEDICDYEYYPEYYGYYDIDDLEEEVWSVEKTRKKKPTLKDLMTDPIDISK
ncbi:hypothetical protein [Pyrococcus kukulkanii]|uniref:JAB domain-containing protein n=1 Tax=Pyrococcus kukulkanii TaxID=1609559 RepID=A0ABV4T607_9EURY